MSGRTTPGPLGMTPVHFDEGTLIRHVSHAPGPVGHKAHARAPHHVPHGHPRTLVLTMHDKSIGTGTDDGQAWRFSVSPDVGWLYDFRIKSAELRGAHRRYLDHTARRILSDQKKSWCVAIQGRASRTGSDASNLALSLTRANEVYKYLKAQVPKATLIPYGLGEVPAAQEGDKDGKENMFQRAVLVSVWAVSESDDKDKQKPLPPPPPDKEFQMRVLGGVTVGADIKLLSGGPYVMKFQIIDVEAKMACDFYFHGTSGTVSYGLSVSSLLKLLKRKAIPIPGYGAIIRKGKPQSFRVPRDWALTNIEGLGKMSSLGPSAAGKSLGPTEFSFTYAEKGKQPYWQTVEHLNIPTWGLPSVGATLADGPLTRSGKPYHYDGK